MTFKRIVWAIALSASAVAAIAFGATGLIAWQNGSRAQTSADGGRWVAITSTAESFELNATGKLVPARIVEIPAPANGTLASVAVTLGDIVRQGQELARIDSPELQAQMRTAEAAALRGAEQARESGLGDTHPDVTAARRRLGSAQSALMKANTRLAEAESLYEKGFVARNEVDAALAELEGAQLQQASSQDELKAVERKFSHAQLRAVQLDSRNQAAEWEQLQAKAKRLHLVSPISGVVVQPESTDSRYETAAKAPVEGGRVTLGSAVFAVADTSSFSVRGQCREADLAWLEPGLKASVIVAALPSRQFSGTVVRVLGAVPTPAFGGPGGESSVGFEVSLQMDPASLTAAELSRLRLGSKAAIHIQHQGNARQAVMPIAAVQWRDDGGAQVLLRAPGGSATGQLVPVRIARAGVNDVQVFESLGGEVWVPSADAPSGPEPRGLGRIFGP